jgi:ABC-type transporter Mla maintaining outer membrane lipid asymmetry ATPase subunit MlaF
LVRGSSGHGKSTLVKGITGQLGGVEIDYLDARVFRDSFVLVG